VQTFAGRVEEVSGSGVVAVFGLEPVEDAPRRAAPSAMAIRRAAARAREHDPARPGARLAIHTVRVPVGGAGSGVDIEARASRTA
jgi:class 3 adenylate cyclase